MPLRWAYKRVTAIRHFLTSYNRQIESICETITFNHDTNPINGT